MYLKPNRGPAWVWAGMYLLVVLVALNLLRWGSPTAALPVLAPPGERPLPVPSVWHETIHWRGWLEHGFLYLAPDPTVRPTSWMNRSLEWASGIRLGDIRSLLEMEIPALTVRPLDYYWPTTGRESSPAPIVINLPAGLVPPPPPEVPVENPIRVGIYHTHARESFLPDMGRRWPADSHTDDLEITVVKLGRELASLLSQEYGIGVVHSAEVHDAAGKVGSYIRSEVTGERMLRDYPELMFLLDIHRDSARRAQTTATVEGEPMARVMILLGTKHHNWRENYAVARDFIDVLESWYPGLTIGIFTRSSRYNQHLSSGALLLEVGGVENTLEEALRSARALARVIAHLVERDWP